MDRCDSWIAAYWTAPPADGRVVISNDGFYPSEALFECAGARFYGGTSMLQCLPDGTWTDEAQRCWSMLEVFVMFSIGLLTELLCFLVYYLRVIARKAPPLSQMSFISDESKEGWSTPLY